MELPRDAVKRHHLYRDLIRTCETASRQDRRDRHRRLRGLALTGTDTMGRAKFNALKEWQRLSTSLVYAPENVQFGPVYPPYYGGRDQERFTNEDMEQMVELQREDFHRLWFDSTSPEVFRQAVNQAHYADTALIKLYINHGLPEIDLIPDPSDFCVLEESRRIDQQEAMVHFYTAALPQFWRMLMAADLADAERERIFRLAIVHATPRKRDDVGDVMGAFQPLLIAATTPNMIGNVNRMSDTALGLPQSTEPVAPLAELWVWDDRASAVCARCRLRREHHWHVWTSGAGHEFRLGDYVGDWRVATVFLPTDDVLYEPINPLGIGRHAFFPLQLGDPEAGYAWSISPMEPLVALQFWLNEKIGVVDWYDEMTMDPPVSFAGVAGRDGEEMRGWRKPGGNIPLNLGGNAKVEFHRPPLKPDEFAFVNKILEFMYQIQGIPKVMRGLADPGMRSADQPIAQAMLAAGPTLSMAMTTERCLQDIATAKAHLWRNINDRALVRNNGERFYLSQMPEDFTMRVFSHSASPVYAEDIRNRALAAHKQGLLTAHDALRFQNFPGTDMLLRTAAKLEEGQAKQREELINLKKTEVEAKKLRALK